MVDVGAVAGYSVKRGGFRAATRRVSGLAVLWFVLGLISSTGAFAAHAYLWSDPIKTANRGVFGAGGREALYTYSSQGGAPFTERVFNPSGAVEWEVKTEITTIMPPALASDGSGYVVWVSGGSDVIEAINRAGTVRWSYTVPNGAAVTGLVAGSDGAAYVSVSGATGGKLMRLSPTDGSVTFATPIPEADYGGGELFAEPSGVAVGTATHVLFVSQQGQITATSEPLSPIWATSNNAGDVFVGSLRSGETGTANGIAVTKVEPTGHVAWTATTPANGGAAAPTSLAALPDGGVAYDVSSQSVGVLNADGTSRWNTENHQGYAGRMLTDGSDHVDLASLVNGATCSDNVQNCGGFHLEQVEATNGRVARVVSVVSTKDGEDDWFCGGLALGSQMFYVLDDPTTPGPSTCTPAGKPQLQAYALPETAGPYPTPPATTEPAREIPPATYVALGDSYSSGEGNPPYEAGTDVPGLDKCHRSEESAYSRLLDGARGLGPMTFKACSGALTDDFFTTNLKNPEEGAQLAWLGPQTKTVTLTIGGNDGGFPYILEHCVEGPRWPKGGLPYVQPFGCSQDQALRAETLTRLAALAGSTTDFTPPPEPRPIHPMLEVIKAVHTDAPNARLVVGGYPLLFGTSSSTYQPESHAPSGYACTVGSTLGLWFKVDYFDALWLNGLGRKLNAVIAKAVSIAKAEGISVSYAAPQFGNHGLCDTGSPWLNALEFSGATEPSVESFHPNAGGQILGYEPAVATQLK